MCYICKHTVYIVGVKLELTLWIHFCKNKSSVFCYRSKWLAFGLVLAFGLWHCPPCTLALPLCTVIAVCACCMCPYHGVNTLHFIFAHSHFVSSCIVTVAASTCFVKAFGLVCRKKKERKRSTMSGSSKDTPSAVAETILPEHPDPKALYWSDDHIIMTPDGGHAEASWEYKWGDSLWHSMDLSTQRRLEDARARKRRFAEMNIKMKREDDDVDPNAKRQWDLTENTQTRLGYDARLAQCGVNPWVIHGSTKIRRIYVPIPLEKGGTVVQGVVQSVELSPPS